MALEFNDQALVNSASLAQAFAFHSPSVTNRKFFVLVGTSTPEKVAQMNAAARLNKIPVTFACYKEVMDILSAEEEDGNRLLHALGKSASAGLGASQLLNSPKHNAALRALCSQYNVPYDPQNIFYLTEDSSLSVEDSLWKKLRPHLAPYLEKDLLDRAEKEPLIFGDDAKVYTGPGTELGPIFGAIGITNLMNMIRDLAPAGELTKVLDASTVVVSNIADTEDHQKFKFTAMRLNCIVNPEDESPLIPWLDSTTQHTALLSSPTKPLATDMDAYLKKHSPRTKAILQVFRHLASTPYTKPAPAFASIARQLTTSNDFRIRLMNAGPLPTKTPWLKDSLVSFVRAAKSANPLLQPIDLSPNYTSETDAYLFQPIAKHNLKALRRSSFRFFSTLVEKSLESASMKKPIVVVDDGSLAQMIYLYRYFINTGMSKDFEVIPAFEPFGTAIFARALPENEGIEHKILGLVDIIQPQYPHRNIRQKRLNRAAEKLLLKRRQTYHRNVAVTPHLKVGPTPTNLPYLDNAFRVAFFTSASSDNNVLLSHNRALVANLATLGDDVAMVWGAGDRHAMEALQRGALYNDIYAEGYSTPSILVTESKNGRMPECSYSETTPNIFERMAKMLRSDVVVVTPGGIGTAQEMLAYFILMDEAPELMKDKAIVFHNPVLFGKTPYWNPVIETFLGKEALTQMTKNHNALGAQNIYMTTTVAENGVLLQQLKEKKALNATHAPTAHRPEERGNNYPPNFLSPSFAA